MKRGISLITLIITIVVIIILAAAVVLSLTANNPINSAKKAALISNRESIMSAINLYYSNATINLNIQNNFNNSYNQETILTGIGNTEDMTGEVKSYRITSLKDGVDENSNSLTKDDIERETIQIENNDIEVFKIDEKKAKEKGINIPSTNKNSSWYFDKNGSVYLVFEEDADIPSNIKGNPEEGKLIEDNDLSKFISKKGYKYIKKSIYDLVPESPAEMFTYSTSTNSSGERIATITGLNPSYPTEKIPKEIKFPAIYKDESGNEYKVTTIKSSAFKGNTIFETVVVPEGVTKVESLAFSNCEKLVSVYLPSTLSSISTTSASPFYLCTNIENITVPNYMVSTSATPNVVFGSSKSKITSVEFSGDITSISSGAFASFTALTTIRIPDTVTKIEVNAFNGCSSLAGKIIIPENVESIGLSAFSSCNISELEFKSKGKLKTIGSSAFAKNAIVNLVIPEGVTKVEFLAFSNCEKLTNVYLPSTLSSISTASASPFYLCANIEKITVPNYMVSTNCNPGVVFLNSKSKIKSVEFSDNITSISSNAFVRFTALTTIRIPDTVTKIEANVFNGCSSLAGKIIIPENVESIGSNAFSSCNISELEFKSKGKLKTIGSSAFAKNAIVNLVIPEGVTKVEFLAFSNCEKLTNVYLPSTLSSISTASASPFYLCANIEKITVPNYMVSTNCNPSVVFLSSKSKITSVEFSDNITSISSNAFASFTALTTIRIPDTVTKIEVNAFNGCSSLAGKIIIPENVESIGLSAFSSCNISELEFKSKGKLKTIGSSAFAKNAIVNLVIPEGVTKVEFLAFSNCEKLTNVYLPSTLSSISTTSASPFDSCPNIKKITVPNYMVSGSSVIPKNVFSSSKSKIKSVEFSDTITSISANAFYGFSSITSITIPESVTQIGNSAFGGCSSLTTINYKGDATGAPWGATNATVIK